MELASYGGGGNDPSFDESLGVVRQIHNRVCEKQIMHTADACVHFREVEFRVG